MIHELTWFTLLFMAVILIVWVLAENETLRDFSERRAINKLADKSRRAKPQTVRPRSKYASVGWRPEK